jgi:hypothetical protein
MFSFSKFLQNSFKLANLSQSEVSQIEDEFVEVSQVEGKFVEVSQIEDEFVEVSQIEDEFVEVSQIEDVYAVVSVVEFAEEVVISYFELPEEKSDVAPPVLVGNKNIRCKLGRNCKKPSSCGFYHKPTICGLGVYCKKPRCSLNHDPEAAKAYYAALRLENAEEAQAKKQKLAKKLSEAAEIKRGLDEAAQKAAFDRNQAITRHRAALTAVILEAAKGEAERERKVLE